ncbi:MAG TPA: hypothetical protein VFZ59_07985 [Verrucomicrobiae bacterium]|nr:hypothetical protein [Verrucomicrobiae bacterium]
MRTIAAIGLFFAAKMVLFAQTIPVTPAISSASGQFTIIDRSGAPPPALPASSKAKGFFDLQAPFLAVSCERIQGALNAELGTKVQWQGKIHLTISPVRNSSDDYAISVDRFRNAWRYHVNLPQRVEQTMYVRTVVQALLLELANRQASERSAEVPFWLVEGLTQKLLNSRQSQLILEPPGFSVRGVKIDPTMFERSDHDWLEKARRVLRERPPMTLEELSWPRAEEFNGPKGEAFRCSAQLFVTELLRLKGGRDCLRETIAGLASCYNWQTAFLKAFQTQFPNQLSLEKWWALQVTYFVGRNPQQFWTSEESFRKLDEVLHTAVSVRHDSGDLPVRADVSLQAIIREWDTLRQLTTFRSKLRELELARARVSPEFTALADDYLRVVNQYVKERESSSAIYANLDSMPSGKRKVALQTIQELDRLDTTRRESKPPAPDSWSAVPPPSPGISR